jgi:hypothetical protein
MAEAYAKVNDWSALQRLTADSNWHEFDFLRRAYLTHALRAENNPVATEREWAGAVKSASAQSQSLLLLARIVFEWGWRDEGSVLLWSLTKFADKQLEALHTLYRYYSEKRDTQGLYRVLLRLAELNLGDTGVQKQSRPNRASLKRRPGTGAKACR